MTGFYLKVLEINKGVIKIYLTLSFFNCAGLVLSGRITEKMDNSRTRRSIT